MYLQSKRQCWLLEKGVTKVELSPSTDTKTEVLPPSMTISIYNSWVFIGHYWILKIRNRLSKDLSSKEAEKHFIITNFLKCMFS